MISFWAFWMTVMIVYFAVLMVGGAILGGPRSSPFASDFLARGFILFTLGVMVPTILWWLYGIGLLFKYVAQF